MNRNDKHDSVRAADVYYNGNGYAEKGSPQHNHAGNRVTRGIRPEGESGRRGIHPFKFLKVVWTSSCIASKYVNILIPFIPAAIAVHFALPDLHIWKFALSYIAMVPSANLLGFSGQEFARKLPVVLGVILETFLGSLVEIILFVILLVKESRKGASYVDIIQDAILGSILANLLLCLGVCFFVGGLKRHEQTFHDAVSDTGSNLMLVAGMALVIPTAYTVAIGNELAEGELPQNIRRMSRATAIILLIAFVIYVYFQMSSHQGLYDDILNADEERDRDRHRDLKKDKLTLTECILVLVLSLAFVCLMAYFLVEEIPYIVQERGISEKFMGLILVPLVEKAAEHITAIDEAYDDQMNFALSHVLGASIQTALLNTPLIVLIGWGLGPDYTFTLDFQIFPAVVLILAILVVGGFLRDGKSNYLEGALCVLVYVLIAVAAFFDNVAHGSGGAENAAGAATTQASHAALRMLKRG